MIFKYGNLVCDWTAGVVYHLKQHSDSFVYREINSVEVTKRGKCLLIDDIPYTLETSSPMSSTMRELEKFKEYHDLQIEKLWYSSKMEEVNLQVKRIDKAMGELVKKATDLVPRDSAFWLSMDGNGEDIFKQRQEFFNALGVKRQGSFYKDTMQWALEVSLTEDRQKILDSVNMLWPNVRPVAGYKLLEYGSCWVEKKYLATKAGNDDEWYAITLLYSDEFQVDYGPSDLSKTMDWVLKHGRK